MRLPIALALAATFAVAGCGDAPEDEVPPPAASTQRPTPPRTAADSARAAGQTAGQPAGQRPAGQAAGTAGQRPGGQAAGQPAGQRPGQPAAAGGAGATTTAPAGRLYTVQVAAFVNAEEAQKWAGRLNSLNMPTWTSMAELGGRTFYRVRVGAAPTVSEARQLGDMLKTRLNWPVWIAPVTGADRPPSDAVAATRRILEGA